MANTPSPANILHWGDRRPEDHIMLDSLRESMLSVPVTVVGPLTDSVRRRLDAAVARRGDEGTTLFWLHGVDPAPGHCGVRGATHIAWVVAHPR